MHKFTTPNGHDFLIVNTINGDIPLPSIKINSLHTACQTSGLHCSNCPESHRKTGKSCNNTIANIRNYVNSARFFNKYPELYI